MRIAVCSGSFDPITLGHMDIIRPHGGLLRSGVCLRQPQCRKAGPDVHPGAKAEACGGGRFLELPNVTAELYGGLLADFAAERKATAIVRGIRTQSDFDTEYQQAMVNRGLHPGLETLLLPADPAYIYLSSTVAREMIHYHQPLDKYLPKAILPLIRDWTEQR